MTAQTTADDGEWVRMDQHTRKQFYFKTTLKQHFFLSDEDIAELGPADEIWDAGRGYKPGQKFKMYRRDRVHEFVRSRLDKIRAEYRKRRDKAEQTMEALDSSADFIANSLGLDHEWVFGAGG
jgi:hypothetical protein